MMGDLKGRNVDQHGCEMTKQLTAKQRAMIVTIYDDVRNNSAPLTFDLESTSH